MLSTGLRPTSVVNSTLMRPWKLSQAGRREMYAGGRGTRTARRWARGWIRAIRLGVLPRRLGGP